MMRSIKWIPRSALRLMGIRYWKKQFRGKSILIPIDSAAFSGSALFTRESLYLEALLAKIRPEDLVFDVGAHQGLFALAAAPHAAAVVAFEPHSENRRALIANLRRNGISNTEILPVAVGAGTTVSRLWAGGEQSALTISGSHGPAPNSPDTRMVVVVGLDSLGLQPQIIKIDIEGIEYELLTAASHTLESCRCIGVEIHPPNLAQRGHSEEDVLDVLASYGFEVTSVFRSSSRPNSPSSRHHLILERR